MAFTDTRVKEAYVGDGTTVTFAIPFQVIFSAEDEVKVYLRDESVSPATQDLQTLGSDYYIDGSNVIFYTPPALDILVVVVRELELKQNFLDLINNGAFLPETHEKAMDAVVAMIQQLSERIDRAPLSQITEQITASYNYGEPIASTLIGWNALGTQVQLYSFDDIYADVAADLAAHIADTTAAHAASAISISAITNISATNVQAALAELQANIDLYFGTSALDNNKVLVTNGTGKIIASTITDTELGYLSGATSNLQTHIDNVENNLGLHVTDTTDAHDASSISVVPSGNLSSTDVQAALLELQSDIDGFGSIISSTDDVPEGATNLYYTNERVDDRVAALLVAGTNITLTYNDGAGTLTIDSSGGGSGMAIGDPVTSGTSGSVLFVDGSGNLAQDNSAFYWNDSTNTLIVGDPGSEGSGINLNGTTYNAVLKVSDLGVGNQAEIILHRHSTTITPAIVTSRSNSDTSSHGSVTAGMDLFFISGSGWTGSHYDTFAFINFSVDSAGTVSSTSAPGRIDLRVSPDGSDSPAIALSVRHNKSIEMPGYGTGIAHFSSSGVITSSLIVNADVSGSAAIAYSKLNLASSIVNADVSGSAAIAYSKLNLSGSIVNADISTSAAIGITKIANGTANQLIKANAGATANEFATLSGGTGLSVTFGVGTIALANTGVTSIVAGTGITVSGATGAVTVNSSITQYTDELAQDAVGAMVANSTKVSLTYVDGTPSLTADIIAGSLVNADISASAAIAFSKLATLTAGNVIYGVAGVPTSTALNTIAVTALTGTSNQITVSAAVGSVTLSTPQNIHTGASPTFAGMTLSGLSTGVVHSNGSGVLSSSLIVNADVDAAAAIARSKLASGSNDHVLINSGTGVMSSEAQLSVTRGGTSFGSYTAGDLLTATGATTLSKLAIGASGTILRSTGTAPAWATLATAGIATNTPSYVTLATTTDLTNERVLTGTTNQITVTDGGAGGNVTLSTPQNIHSGASPTFTGLTLSGLTSTGVLYNVSGVITTEAAFNYDQSTNTLYVPMVAGGTASSDNLDLMANDEAFDPTNTGRIRMMERFNFDESFSTSSNVSTAMLTGSGTHTTSAASYVFPAFSWNVVVEYSTSQTASVASAFSTALTFKPTTNGISDSVGSCIWLGFNSGPRWVPKGVGVSATTNDVAAYSAYPTSGVESATAGTITNMTSYGSFAPQNLVYELFVSPLGANTTWTNTRHLWIRQPYGSGSQVNHYGIDIENLTKGSTIIAGIRNQITSGSGKWFIYSSGSAASAHDGLFSFGKITAPSVAVDIDGGLSINSSGSVVNLTADNQVVTVGDRSYIRLSSNNATATNRTFVLTRSTRDGHVLVLEWTGTNAGELVDDSAQNGGGNHRLAGTWTPTQYDTLTLISNGTDWCEISRAAS